MVSAHDLMAQFAHNSDERFRIMRELTALREAAFDAGVTWEDLAIAMGALNERETQEVTDHMQAMQTRGWAVRLKRRTRKKVHALRERVTAYEQGRSDEYFSFLQRLAVGLGRQLDCRVVDQVPRTFVPPFEA